MKKILIDTNAWMAISQFNIDILDLLKATCDFTYTAFVLSGTIEELKKIQETQRGKFALAAKLGLAVLKQKKITIIKSSGKVDDVLVEYSKRGYLVLTQDIGLKRRLKKPYLTIRQKKKIELIK